ncbi:CDP-glycerol glycerophosphotransferase family protein [Haloferacaceae archaeon DSL9]
MKISAPLWKIAASPLLLVMYVLSNYVPRNDTLWVFGAADGEQFVGNSKYAFLEAAKADDVRAVWITKRESIARELCSSGYDAYTARELKAKFLILRARVAVISHGVTDIAPWYLRGATVVQLWHGNALKQIGNDQNPNRTLVNRVFYTLVDNWDYLIVTSEDECGTVFSEAYDFPTERILAAGYPRNDALYRPIDGELLCQDDALHEHLQSIAADKKLLLYVPTWRGRAFADVNNPFHGRNFDPGAFARVLERRDAHLAIKPHPRTALPDGIRSSRRIHVLPPDFDLYPLLPHTAGLITDYSSVYFDYLHLDKPIAFYPYDLDRYERLRGLYYDYESVTPGPAADDFAELLENCDAILAGEDGYAERRTEILTRFYDHRDGRAARRILETFTTDSELDPTNVRAAKEATSDAPFVSVVIPVYNDPDGIETTLRAVVSQTYPSHRYEIIPVDNDSTDETGDRIDRFEKRYANVRGVTEREQRGPGAARNRGIDEASGEIVAFLDADMHVDEDWLATGVSSMPDDVAYMSYDVELYLPPDTNTFAGRYNLLTGFPMKDYVEEQRFGGGGCLFVRAHLFDDVGAFDPRLISDEDLEFGNRVHDSGRDLYFSPDLVAYHPARASIVSLVRKNVRVGRGVCQRQRYYPERYGRPGIPPVPSGDASAPDDISPEEKIAFFGISTILLCSRAYGYGAEFLGYLSRRVFR